MPSLTTLSTRDTGLMGFLAGIVVMCIVVLLLLSWREDPRVEVGSVRLMSFEAKAAGTVTFTFQPLVDGRHSGLCYFVAYTWPEAELRTITLTVNRFNDEEVELAVNDVIFYAPRIPCAGQGAVAHVR